MSRRTRVGAALRRQLAARVRTAGARSFDRVLGPALLASESAPVTRLLYERLTVDDVAEVQARAANAPELAGQPSIPENPAHQPQLVLHYGVFLEVPGVLAHTGLIADQPPVHVHAMARGPLAAGGGVYEADLVVSALTSAGVDIGQAQSGLDFGCSSGRVLRVLAAAYPEVQWRGCDPNEGAIRWASEQFESISFFANPQLPPLPVDQGALGVAYAISIWSHFGPELGLRWFDEMHRIIRPGGHLVLTTHGLQSVAFYVANGMRSPEQAAQISDGLYRDGFWYAAEFGHTGDAGVINPEWGTAFLTPEWLLTKLCPRWRVLEYAPGRNQDNQDVYVLQRA